MASAKSPRGKSSTTPQRRAPRKTRGAAAAGAASAGAERDRLAEDQAGRARWKRWGPYLSERQWGTVREDYSPSGTAWEYLPHDHARSQAYRWGEDGLAGFSDDRQLICLSLGLWNHADPILKERLFGLTNNEGNHGEDVKELYYYLDALPTHAYMKMLYKYPQRPFPYEQLVGEARVRGKEDPEFELLDTGLFDDDRYFDVFVEYAKDGPDDILMRITAWNRGPEEAPLDLLPQVCLRNTWSWKPGVERPALRRAAADRLEIRQPRVGEFVLYADRPDELLLTENETNARRLYCVDAPGPFKDAFHEYVVMGRAAALSSGDVGTKAAARYRTRIPAGGSHEVRLRLTDKTLAAPFRDFGRVFDRRRREADEFYAALQRKIDGADARLVQRQALAGMIWSKQYYHYNLAQWLEGDPLQPPPPSGRRYGRNRDWEHVNNSDIISMPDKWEYPWYAAWDLAFHCLPLALVDAEFSKSQLDLLTREWYMHPNGQLPAYEWAFDDVNPPVHAWATWRVFQIDRNQRGDAGDLKFLERVFHKLLLNFTWWVNRKDADGRNVFQGGFLGLDNIGVFDRSAPLPTGGHIDQSDGTSWMAMYSLNLLRIALELARHNDVYEDIATKFFEHFLSIAKAMTNIGAGPHALLGRQEDIDDGVGMWDEADKFYYDVLHLPDRRQVRLRIRSMVGLIPLFAVETLEPETLDALPGFKQRLEWLLTNKPDLAALVSRWHEPGRGHRRLLSLLRGHRMKRLLARCLDESEFLSDYGVRALSKHHERQPYVFWANGTPLEVSYQPGESTSGVFGGNSNWRGPIWMPLNYLLIESLQKFHHYYGDDFRVECPTGSGKYVTICDVADELAGRLTRLFLRDTEGRRAVFGGNAKLQQDPHFRDYVLFHEYFHGDSGRGVGASHQTGWTGLVAKLLHPRRPLH